MVEYYNIEKNTWSTDIAAATVTYEAPHEPYQKLCNMRDRGQKGYRLNMMFVEDGYLVLSRVDTPLQRLKRKIFK
jgi:hypothetical protein